MELVLGEVLRARKRWMGRREFLLMDGDESRPLSPTGDRKRGKSFQGDSGVRTATNGLGKETTQCIYQHVEHST